MTAERAYFDHAATSPLTDAARSALRDAEGAFGNASSVHAEGRRARAIIDDARSLVAEALGAPDDEIVFTGSGTEAVNLAVRGAVAAASAAGRRHIVISAIEHDAVRRTAHWLEHAGLADVTTVACTADGVVEADAMVAALRADTALVALMLVNNEIGTIQPVAAVAQSCRERQVPLFVDAVQSAGRISLEALADVPLVALSPHKVGGPRGVGVLRANLSAKLVPTMTGGGQESGLRAGTEAVALIAAGARALADAIEAQPERARALASLDARLHEGLAALAGTRLAGESAPRAPGITTALFAGCLGQDLVAALDLEGFAVSSGSACSSGTVRASHVLEAMGHPELEARSGVRFSFDSRTRESDIDRLLRVLPAVLARARGGIGYASA